MASETAVEHLIHAPPFDAPAEHLDAAASAARIRALASLLDPSVGLDDAAVRVRA